MTPRTHITQAAARHISHTPHAYAHTDAGAVGLHIRYLSNAALKSNMDQASNPIGRQPSTFTTLPPSQLPKTYTIIVLTLPPTTISKA